MHIRFAVLERSLPISTQNNLNDFKILRKTLEYSSTCHHTYTPKEVQHTNVVLRHLDSSYDENDILASINSLGLDIKVSKIIRMTSAYNNLWLIQLYPGSDTKQLLGQRYLLNQKIIFERKNKDGISQCKNCQSFGHSARNCRHEYRCVKCKDSHAPGKISSIMCQL